MNREQGRTLKEAFVVLSKLSSGETEENHQN
jgi:hypothetical protein